MAPTRSSHGNMIEGEASTLCHDKGKQVARRGKGTATQAQLQAQAAIELFKDHIPLISWKVVKKVQKDLWEKLKAMLIEEVCQEVEYWIVDPGSMAGRASTYDRIIMLYWVIMNLVTHVTLNLEAKKEDVVAKKEGDEEPTRAWKDHNEYCRLIHRNFNQIASHVGIFLYCSGMEQQLGGGSIRKTNG